MGILASKWQAKYEGHDIVVARNELTRGFNISWDGTEIAHRTWSWVGLGELHGSAELNGKPVEISVTLKWGGPSEMNGHCTLKVDGKEIPVEHVK
jgi:hypothetical protein